MSILTNSGQCCTTGPDQSNNYSRKEKNKERNKKDIHIRKEEVKLFLFAGDVLLCI